MQKIITGVILVTLMSSAANMAFAAPNNEQKAANNPQVVAYYPDGTHGVVGEDQTHIGVDLVQQAGNSGNFQQWFTGSESSDPSTKQDGDHSVWKSVGDQTSCPSGWNLVVNANQSWGNYLQSGNYCVHTNDF